VDAGQKLRTAWLLSLQLQWEAARLQPVDQQRLQEAAKTRARMEAAMDGVCMGLAAHQCAKA
jgi:hypothetical protein